MVRLKQRYILFEILYPPAEDEQLFSNSPEDALLGLHQSSPASINPQSLTRSIRKVIQDHFGDHGAGTAGLLIQVKYFSNKTSTGIVRCSRLSASTVVGALTLIDNFDGENVLIKVSRVSATIKKCEQYSIQRSQQLMRLFKRSNKDDMQKFINNFENVKDDDEEDIIEAGDA